MGNGVGQRIKEYRLTHGLTLAELSKRTGIPAPTLNRYELGQRKPTSEILAQISVALGLPLAYLMGLDDNLKASLAESIPKDDIIAKIPGAFPLNPTHKIPLLGQISAGLPLYAEENVEGYLWTDLNHGAEYFGLRVKGVFQVVGQVGIKRIPSNRLIIFHCRQHSKITPLAEVVQL